MKMKDSGVEWIGEIPEDWTVQKVKHQFDRKKGKPETEDYEILKLARSGIQIRDISSGDGQIAADYSGYNPVEPLDILINPMDLISGDNSNISKVSGVISQAYINLRFRSSINTHFYNYYFKLQYWLGAFFTHGKGVSFDNRWTINDETLRNFPIIVPTLNEQNKIVEFLDSKLSLINQIIADTKRSIEELKSYKQSLITETVTKGLDPNVPMKDSGVEWIGEIPEKWKIGKLNYYVTVHGRIGYRGYTVDDIVGEREGAISLSPSNISNMQVYDYKNTYIKWEKYKESPEIKVRENDLVYVKTGSGYGKAGIVKKLTEKATINPQLVVLKPKSNNDSRFINYLLNSFLGVLQSELIVGGSTMPTISQEKILKMIFPIINYDEQIAIADFLDKKNLQIDTMLSAKNSMVDNYESYKKSLIYEYVTGKKQVN
ncbi:restriction endonuclease subunit S [Lactococcus garvieae]|uniref:restriction endonuclease subunit S n=1 Tax=Lactococcus garvieae TaxID=1363 RepID=UPI0023EB3774|nr:restriction endonuclease subunit S [Lactococcus garvieae]